MKRIGVSPEGVDDGGDDVDFVGVVQYNLVIWGVSLFQVFCVLLLRSVLGGSPPPTAV